MRIGSIDDCLNFQVHLDHFVEYFKVSGLNQNLSKCKLMTFFQDRWPIIHLYHLLDSDALRTNSSVIDLGI